MDYKDEKFLLTSDMIEPVCIHFIVFYVGWIVILFLVKQTIIKKTIIIFICFFIQRGRKQAEKFLFFL